MNMTRVGGGNFTGECNIVYFFNNGAAPVTVWRDSMAGIPGTRVIDTFHPSYLLITPAAGNNVQFAVQHNDVVNYQVTIDYLYFERAHEGRVL